MFRTGRILFFVGLLGLSLSAKSQSWLWARTAGGVPNDESRCVRNDPAGNVLIAGAYRTAVMSIGALTVTNRSTVATSDALVVKYDPQGNELWAVSMGGTNNDVARALDCDGYGNVYVTGYFRSTVFYCGDDSLLNTGLSAADLFLTKISPNGNVLWVRKITGTGSDFSNSIDVDSLGNSYIAGYFTSDSLFVGPDTLYNLTPSLYDAVIMKADSAGNFIWGRSLAGTGDDEGQGVTIGTGNRIYFSGFFSSPFVVIKNQSIGNTSPGFDEVFVVSLNDAGQVLWRTGFGGSENDRSYAITADHAGRLYTTGRFGSPTFTFGPITLTNSSAAFTPDIFVIRIDPANGNPMWGQQAGGLLDDLGEGIACDPYGNVIVTGRFTSDQLVFGVQTLVNASTPNSDIFIVEYDSLGATRWAYREGEGLSEYGQSVCAFDSTVYLTGFYRDSIFQLSPFTLVNGSTGNQDLYLAALYQPGVLPAELLSFTARPNAGRIYLAWITAQENNSDFFILERSSDGHVFDSIARIKAAGFSNRMNTYGFTDNIHFDEGVYYRLCLTDINGKKTYFRPVYVEKKTVTDNEAHLSLISNPPWLAVEIEGFSGPFRLRIFDMTGKEILSMEDQCESSACSRLYETGIQPAGVYLCILESREGIVARERYVVR